MAEGAFVQPGILGSFNHGADQWQAERGPLPAVRILNSLTNSK